jgi:hypothetical protein
MVRASFGFLFLFAVLFATVSEAAPRRRYTYSTPQTTTSMPRVSAYTSSSMPMYTGSGGHTGSAQGVAEMMASRGVMQHFGGNSGYEGVGMGSTPEQALGNCCYSNSGMAVVDQGVACGRNGRWYACKRYR